MTSQDFSCKWANCIRVFNNYEELLKHLSHQHIGKKATGTLSTHCLWENCGVMTAKRDHLMSHLKVHLPVKPFKCSLCHKAFKRSYDLKKHERIHTEEHQASLASNQPGYKPARRPKKRSTQDSSQSNSRSESMDESISSRDQQLQQNEPFDPLYQNIIPEINQMPLIFVPEDPSAIYNSLIVSPEALENDHSNSLYPIVPAHEDINIPLREEEIISPIYPNISSFDSTLWNNSNHRRGDSLPILSNPYPLSSMVNSRNTRLKKSLTTNSSDQKYAMTFEERRHLVHLANVFQAPTTDNIDDLWKTFSNISLKQKQ